MEKCSIDKYPCSEAVEQRRVGNFYLTGSYWHNEYGSNQPETGILDLQRPRRFMLCQHFDMSIKDALDEIQWRLEAGWCPRETCGDVERLAEELEDARKESYWAKAKFA